jgi:hypothetical protein
MSGETFQKLKGKLENEGYSDKESGAIDASIGRKSEGKAVFDKHAAEGRRKAAARVAKHRGKK